MQVFIGQTLLNGAGSVCFLQSNCTRVWGKPHKAVGFRWFVRRYPMSPPVVRFLTRILHPNVSRHGDVGIDSVHHNWSLALTISKVLISIQSLLTDPYTTVSTPHRHNMYHRRLLTSLTLVVETLTHLLKSSSKLLNVSK